jgi:hypothetical protein
MINPTDPTPDTIAAIRRYFSRPFASISQAQAFCGEVGFLATFAILRTPDGEFVAGDVRYPMWTQEHVAVLDESMRAIIGFEVAAYTDPLFGWQMYAPRDGGPEAARE